MQQELKKNDIQPVLVAYGSVSANRTLATEYRLDWPILPFKNTEVEKIMTDSVFENCGTPSAYMLDGEGKVEHRLVVGSDAIVDMVRSELKKASLKRSRIEREGLKVGTPAPVFALLDIHDNGETIALDQFRGRKVLLVFSDPHCGPCDELARRYGLSARTVFRWTFEKSHGARPRKLGRALGIDEYARRKGHRYNTIIVDLAKGRPITTFKGRRVEDVMSED